MSRRVVVSLSLVLAITGGGPLVARGIRAIAAGHFNIDRAPSPDGGKPTGTSSVLNAGHVSFDEPPASETAAARTSRKRNQIDSDWTHDAAHKVEDGFADVDPHKAFGSKNAPIVMEVFSDYQCPSCKTLFLSTNRRLMENYVNTGKVYLIYRDFPLPMHAYSRIAARYARAAAEIGKGEPVDRALFENQEKWEQNGDVDGTVSAVLAPSDMTKIRALVKGGTLEALIDKDYALGQTYRVNSTPTTIVHSKGQTYPFSGVLSYENLRQFLDQLLNQK